MTENLQVFIANVPSGPLQVSDFELRRSPAPACGPGEVLCRTLAITIGAGQRAGLQGSASYAGAPRSGVVMGGTGLARVEVSNAAAGHYVPTGSPMRQLVLEVTADPYSGRQLREERVYRRTLADSQGKPVEREPQAFLRGAKVTSDNRLTPGEKRIETFRFPVPAGTQTQVQATFWYYYSPLAQTESQQRVTFLTLRRLVK